MYEFKSIYKNLGMFVKVGGRDAPVFFKDHTFKTTDEQLAKALIEKAKNTDAFGLVSEPKKEKLNAEKTKKPETKKETSKTKKTAKKK